MEFLIEGWVFWESEFLLKRIVLYLNDVCLWGVGRSWWNELMIK